MATIDTQPGAHDSMSMTSYSHEPGFRSAIKRLGTKLVTFHHLMSALTDVEKDGWAIMILSTYACRLCRSERGRQGGSHHRSIV